MTTARPNIIFIMSDDHAANAISCYGSGLNATPNIDRLANEGMRLDHCYVTNSICTPSRASILTGTYNHVNCVTTLATHMDNRLPHVAKHLRASGYETAMFGKWHLGEGSAHQPTGFEHWCVLPGQGDYFDPIMIDRNGPKSVAGYATDIITDQSVEFLDNRDRDRPFFLMCHHKAPHRPFAPHPRYRELFTNEDLPVPPTYDDDYSDRALAAEAARMRVRQDMTYEDLGLVQPEGGSECGPEQRNEHGAIDRKVPDPDDVTQLRLIDRDTGEVFTFEDRRQLHMFKYQRYIKRYLRTIAGIDDNVGRLLDYLDDNELTENTIVIYTSDQGFFLGEHGWFDKRFMYEESLQMPFLIRYPAAIEAGTVSKRIATNVDFAPTFLDYAQTSIPTYMQGTSLRPLLEQTTDETWQDVAYHRYWMHKDYFHNAFAHYGVRDARYKLIYWYNAALDQPGAHDGDEPPEWELFDCANDPHELKNVADDPRFFDVFAQMLAKLDTKMAEIGDIPEHDSASALEARRAALETVD
ncbi:sulfatase family protein [Pelagibacterium lentulum]|uniref:Sulfatase n=1 Tax=Pelagibacterium lentulum TaxID=2029865 RepID=A0A916RMQ1_9HYPH|nr:sulfatase [Pelagibacterium lentulum]GGA62108.1 sulfatase [Pelagibacterium lentulum]